MSVKLQKPAGRKAAARIDAHSATANAPPAKRPGLSPMWVALAVAAAALLAGLIAYWPAMHGSFIFDDAHMQFAEPHPDKIPLRLWIIGSRPLVGLSYWLNYQVSGADTFGYHVTNLLLHV